jgi:Flp pilus assembly protein TadG
MRRGSSAGRYSARRERKSTFRWVRRLRRDERGAAMIEFALLLVPFFILLFGIIEVGLVTWGGLELDNATSDAARLVRTGQAQSGRFNETQLKQAVCDRVSLLFNCTSKLRLDVKTFTTFGGVAAPSPLDGQGKLKDSFAFDIGTAEEIVLMSTFYEWPLLNIISSMSISNMADGNRLHRASAAFRNEPFPDVQ